MTRRPDPGSHLRRLGRSLPALALLSGALCAPAPLAADAESARPAWSHELGVEATLDGLTAVAEVARQAGAAGRGLMVRADLDLEDAYGQDPQLVSVEQALQPLRESGLRFIVALHFSGRELPGPSDPERMAVWEAALAALARLGARSIDAVALSLPEAPEAGGRTFHEIAYLIKRTSVALRTIRRDLPVLLDPAGPLEEWLPPLLAEAVGPHLDGVTLLAPEGADAAWVRRQGASLLKLRPGLILLTYGWPAPVEEEVLRTYLAAVDAGASAVLFQTPDADREAGIWTVLARIREQLPDRTPPSSPAPIRFVDADGREVRVAHGHFFDPQAFDDIVWYRPEEPVARRLEAVLATSNIESPSVYNPLNGKSLQIRTWNRDPAAHTSRFEVPVRDHLLLLRYHRRAGPPASSGDLSVETERIPPVEEILARHQEFQEAQDLRLRRWIAHATIALHYRVGTASGDFDLTYDSRLYADPEGTTEWEHRSLSFNGAPYRGKKLPDLPYVLPERVVQVPLRLTLNKDYTYRLAGSATQDGAPCWVVEFEPLDPSRDLYRGRVWIDKAMHARRRLSAVQTKVETPVLSVEDDLRFEPLPGPGEPLWVLKRSRGQQVISISGRNLILVRDIEFDDFHVNPDDFERQREAALASPAFIVRETQEGYETLEPGPDGTRVPRPSGIRKTLLVLGGVFYNEAVSAPVPLGGINYFNFKAGGRDLHVELFAAGAFNFANVTDPSFLGSKWEVGSDLVTRAFPLTDRYLRSEAEGEEIEEFGVDDISQSLSLNAHRQLGAFFKFSGFYGLEYKRYSRDENTRAAFVTPSDTFIHSLEGRLDFDRQGTSIRLFGRASRRGSWEPWGFPTAGLGALGLALPAGAGSLLEEFDPDSRGFLEYGVTVARLWTPSIFQTLRGEVGWLQGSDLDRFSKFRFTTLGDLRVRGFGGSGVRFDQGGIVRAVYTFKVGPLMRLDASLEHARVRDRDLGQDEFLSFTGAGLAGNFTLPAGWIVRLDYGRGLSADLEEREGEQEITLVLLKIL